ncbi:voltage-gated potassium channel [Micromonospora nigra]|uniref:Voltage-gated potassium channel n=1 Tax=Micromonospora nigra TaxID=145857 RepID=A0A1C6SZ23_9ACTN|nr:hypothetical protein [Micromonospora nigra]SCL34619.1 voltage-gated potassium channel [Micromonospora nigra]
MTDRTPAPATRTPPEEDARLNGLARRLDKPMGVLGVLFLLLVLGQAVSRDASVGTALTVASWVLWAVFVAEFTLRAWLARHCAREFWKRNWWQVIFLAVPFLRFARAATALRAARGTGVVAAAVRGSRSAGRLLTDRLAWLAVTTATIILAAGQLLLVTDSYPTYGQALHDVTLTTITGEPLSATDGFSQVLELVLAAYSVAVFGTLAGALGAFFLSRERDTDGRSEVEAAR